MSTKLTNDCRLFKLPGGKSYTRERACTNLHYYTVFLQSDWSILLKYKLSAIITQYGSTVYIGIAMVYYHKPILKENSDFTFSFKLFPFLVTSMSKTYKKE